MKKQLILLITTILVFNTTCIGEASAFFGRSTKKKIQQESVEKNDKEDDSTYKGKAVYLELEGDNVEFDQEKNIYTTKGMSTAKIVDQNAVLEAEEIIYNGNDEKIEATGDVKITRDGIVTTGEFFTFDVTSDRYLLTDPRSKVTGAVITAREVDNPDENNLEYRDGLLQVDNPIRIAQGVGVKNHPRTYYSRQVKRKLLKKPTWDDIPKHRKYKLSARKIIYDNTKEINNLTVIKPRAHFGHFSLPLGPKLTTTINDDPYVMSKPLITPLIGTQGALGGFAVGPSINLNVTNYHILSLAPFAQIGRNDDGFGFGGKITFDGPSTNFELAYGSLNNRFAGIASQRFGLRKRFQVRAAYNRFVDGGFLGRQATEINVGFVDRRSWHPKFIMSITEGGIRLRTEGNWSKGDRDIQPSRLSMLQNEAGDTDDFEDDAFKLEEQIALTTKPVFQLGGERFNTALRFRTRNALRAYSTGDFQGVFTGGPLLDNKIGPLAFEIGYNQGFVAGESPLFFDQFLEGMQSVSLDGDLRVNKYFTIGGYGTYNLKTEELIQRQVRAKFGPEDFKMLVNFDSLRRQVQFGINFLFGNPIDFEKFVIINSARRMGGT